MHEFRNTTMFCLNTELLFFVYIYIYLSDMKYILGDNSLRSEV